MGVSDYRFSENEILSFVLCMRRLEISDLYYKIKENSKPGVIEINIICLK